jgi:hypothetical protein
MKYTHTHRPEREVVAKKKAVWRLQDHKIRLVDNYN